MVATSIIAELCIYILTWNVGTHYPEDVNLTDMLALNGTSSCPGEDKRPDLYILGFQEVNVKPKNQFLNIFQDNQWTLKVREYLSDHDYVKVETAQLQGILINVWSLGKHINNINNIESETTKVGLGGLWGNKGAASVRMSLYGSGVTFVNSHLAAHDEHLKERVIDYNQILDNHHYKVRNYRTIFDHDYVFWFGDLNFRLNGHDTPEEVKAEVELDHLDDLFTRDQLQMVREAGNAFSLLTEEKPTFRPTFKYVEGTSDYDLKRRPAWCDRILYRVEENKYPDIKLELQQLSYKSHPQYTLSDHKPVTAEFLLAIKAEHQTSEDIYEMTHGGAGGRSTETPLSSVIIIFCISLYRTIF
ncbi:phosphatidylinositol 4,5-bisphosphate 5-phosphatase A isoform X1 [Musca autumnalis]|uniref:phosphatidylinositol 4,5-bisphosphate 5-phosphatase A isoform X1 n=1 Tax=Musca autumnalis TaxID=221902 RepID=UPI003CF89EF7